MNRARLQFLLSSALLTACGGTVTAEPAADSGAAVDTASAADTLTVIDTASPPPFDSGGSFDTRPSYDTATSVDTGLFEDTAPGCEPVADSTECMERVTYPCGLPFGGDAGWPTADECRELCAPVKYKYGTPMMIYCSVSPSGSGPGSVVHCSGCAIGRKPSDLIDDARSGDGDPVGIALAEMARIEAASVHAFRRLERTLSELGADARLRERARHAARDEIKHARATARLAKKRGQHPRPVRVRKTAPTTFDLALENAVEGCVHETLGVAYLQHQREHARDPELRTLAASLYDDELDHAALSWDLLPFFDRHLTAEQRAELRHATERALDDVVEEMGRVHPTVHAALGLPPREVVARMVQELRQTLFS